LHPYSEKPGDIITKQLRPNGSLYMYFVLKEGKPANGWSSKTWFKKEGLQQEENYSNGLLIEKISYNESGVIAEHKIWNNRLKQLIDKPAQAKLLKPSVVTGHGSLNNYLKQLPAIGDFINADYEENSLLLSFDAGSKLEKDDAKWTMRGEQMSFTIYWDHDEVSHQWHCHCATEALYWKAREFLHGRL
jgi:hypothetical protein